MNPTSTPQAGRHSSASATLAVLTAAATWVLLLVGCLVHGTGSSLACPDWPLCFGSAFPKMENGVQFEHSHRLVATAVGILTIALAALLHRERSVDRAASRLGYLAVFLVCVQGGLGGVTVVLKLPIVVTLAHLGTSMAFFCLTALLALRTRDGARAERPPPAPKALGRLRPWLGLAVLGTFGQIMLGGAVRHTASGLACFGIPLCNGALWPGHDGAHVHMAHRFVAVLLSALVLVLGVKVRRRAPGTRLSRLASLAMALILVQVGLGVLSVLSLLALLPVTLHLGVAALVLVCNVALFYYLPASAHVPMANVVPVPARVQSSSLATD